MLNNDKSILNSATPTARWPPLRPDCWSSRRRDSSTPTSSPRRRQLRDAFVTGRPLCSATACGASPAYLKDPRWPTDRLAPYPVMMEDGAHGARGGGFRLQHKRGFRAIDEAKEFLSFLQPREPEEVFRGRLPSAFTDVDAEWAPASVVEGVNSAVESAANIGYTNEKPAGFTGDDAGRMVQDLLAGQYTAEEFAAAYEAAWDAGFGS
ncbi:MAG: hypothetical protein ACLUEK_04355 [Oscillospiraceae bacterium]